MCISLESKKLWIFSAALDLPTLLCKKLLVSNVLASSVVSESDTFSSAIVIFLLSASVGAECPSAYIYAVSLDVRAVDTEEKRNY